MMRVESLYFYPVKSFKGIASDSLAITEFGPNLDRRFMLVDEEGVFVTQRKDPLLSQASASFADDSLIIELPEGRTLSYPINNFCLDVDAQVWRDHVDLKLSKDKENDLIISEWLGKPVRMSYMPDSCFRQVDRDFFSDAQRVSLADGFPLLLTNNASLGDLNQRLDEPVTMKRFRPNLVIDGHEAFEEDGWSRIRVGDVEFALVKPCSRCVMTTIDDQGNKGREPLRTLSTYRRNDYGVCFGQNLVPINYGDVKVGDLVEIID